MFNVQCVSMFIESVHVCTVHECLYSEVKTWLTRDTHYLTPRTSAFALVFPKNTFYVPNPCIGLFHLLRIHPHRRVLIMS